MLDLNPDADSRPHASKRRVGDVIAVTADSKKNNPSLGVILDQKHRSRHSSQCDVFGDTLYRIPTPTDSPNLKFLDEHTPYLYLGMPHDTLGFVISSLTYVVTLVRAVHRSPHNEGVPYRTGDVIIITAHNNLEPGHYLPPRLGIPFDESRRVHGKCCILQLGDCVIIPTQGLGSRLDFLDRYTAVDRYSSLFAIFPGT